MKINNEVLDELKKIRAGIDDMYNKLNITLYTKNVGVKVSYSETNPFDSVQENFEYITTKIRELQDSEIIGD
jgi:hypothetical protein|tara:strand:- start:5932 stop:6147 length:216 start_codon:yes stop_codon:yes gene_type:complete